MASSSGLNGALRTAEKDFRALHDECSSWERTFVEANDGRKPESSDRPAEVAEQFRSCKRLKARAAHLREARNALAEHMGRELALNDEVIPFPNAPNLAVSLHSSLAAIVTHSHACRWPVLSAHIACPHGCARRATRVRHACSSARASCSSSRIDTGWK